MLPEEFVETAAARGWMLPAPDEVAERVPSVGFYIAFKRRDEKSMARLATMREGSCGIDYSVWLEWAKRLPEVPALHPSPDPRVLGRFSLVYQCPSMGEDEPDEQMDGFDELWDKVGDQYGRHAQNVGDDRVIEWISDEHRETVVALVLEGLRRFELTDRVKVSCGRPAPDDWQRDRDVAIWPPAGAPEPGATADGGRDLGSS
jgi:hypothetical protein